MRCHDLANQALDRANQEGRQGFDAELAKIKAEYGDRDAREAKHLAELAVSTKKNGYSLAWREDHLRRKRGEHG